MSKPKDTTTGVCHITVKGDDDGQRLDRWLRKNTPDMPYGLLQKIIRKGQLRVDGKRAKSDTRLSAGQEVRIPPLEVQASGAKNTPKKLSPEDIEFIRSLVIYDNGDIVAINKPYGLPVQGGSKVKRHIDGLLDGLKNKEGITPRLVHRLDKDTSGILLLARTAKMAKALGEMFKTRKIKKIYWAIITPPPDIPEGSIKAPLTKMGRAGRERVQIDEKEGRFALTEFSVLETARGVASFVAFWPKTGRTHQIRAHAEILGCPILGDPKYKREAERHVQPDELKTKEKLADLDLANRLHLHAHDISFKHPVTKKWVHISAPLSYDLQKSWKAFGFNHKYKGDPFEDVEL